MSTYVDWGALRHVVSVVGLPSISVSVGFTDEDYPSVFKSPVSIMLILKYYGSLTPSKWKPSTGDNTQRYNAAAFISTSMSQAHNRCY